MGEHDRRCCGIDFESRAGYAKHRVALHDDNDLERDINRHKEVGMFVRLSDEQRARLDEAANRYVVGRSVLIRNALDFYLDQLPPLGNGDSARSSDTSKEKNDNG